MSQQDPEAQPLTAEDFDFDQSSSFQDTSRPVPSRSPYHLPASEQLQGVANRIIFSRYYILFYGAMMALSLATLVLSLVATRTFIIFINCQIEWPLNSVVVAVDKGQCPPIAWHIIEFVLNALMVLEVTTRWIANGRVRFRFAIRSSNPIHFIHLKTKSKSKEKGGTDWFCRNTLWPLSTSST